MQHIFHRWGIDLVGPLKETKSGCKYIAVATEYLTKWPEICALMDKSAAAVHKFLMSLVYRYGACHVLLHDQGREFCNSLVDGLCREMGIAEATTLDDRIMDAVNKLVSDRIFSAHNQSTLMAQSMCGFDRVTNEHIQVLYEDHHWVCTACLSGEVMLADSLPCVGISPMIVAQMHQLYESFLNKDGKLPIVIKVCDKQTNSDDCGVYAAAFAFDLALGKHDLDRVYVPTSMRMRDHLMTCLVLRQVLAFPCRERRRRNHAKKVVALL